MTSTLNITDSTGQQSTVYDGTVVTQLTVGGIPWNFLGYTTVSAIGTSTAGVVLPNNGASYGPDTLNTTTSGIMEALLGLPQVLNPTTDELVPMGRVLLVSPQLYTTTSKIYVKDDWVVSLEGTANGFGNSAGLSGSYIDIAGGSEAGFALLPSAYSLANSGIMENQGAIALRNLSFVPRAGVLFSGGVITNLGTQMAQNTYYIVNIGSYYNDASATTRPVRADSLLLENVRIRDTQEPGNAALNIITDRYEDSYQALGALVCVGSSYHNSLVETDLNHWIADTMDISSNTTTSGAYPNWEIGVGVRHHVGYVHMGGNAVYPMHIKQPYGMYSVFIDGIGWETNNPGTVTGLSGNQFLIQGGLVVGSWNGEWNPLMGGVVRTANTGYIRLAFPVGYGNNSGSNIGTPLGTATAFNLNTPTNGAVTNYVFFDRPYVRLQYISLQASASTVPVTPANGATIGYVPITTGNVHVRAVVRGVNSTAGDGIVVGVYQGSFLLDSEMFTQVGAVANLQTFVLDYTLLGQTLGSAQTFTIQINAVTGGTVSVSIKEFLVEEI